MLLYALHKICSVGQQGELAMTINIGEECAHNEIQLLYTKSHSFPFPYKRMSGIWFQLQSKDVRRSGSCLHGLYGSGSSCSVLHREEEEENASPTTTRTISQKMKGAKEK